MIAPRVLNAYAFANGKTFNILTNKGPGISFLHTSSRGTPNLTLRKEKQIRIRYSYDKHDVSVCIATPKTTVRKCVNFQARFGPRLISSKMRDSLGAHMLN